MLERMIGNLQGLQNLSVQARQVQQAEKQQNDLREASDYLRKYKASVDAGTPDTDSLNEAILRSPELSQSVLSGIGLVDKQRQQKAAGDIVELYAATDNPEMFNRVAARRVNDIMSSGGDPKDTLSLVKTFNEQGADAARKAIRPIGAAMVNQGLVKGEMLGFGGGTEPMTAYQAASTDLRKQELEMRKQEKATETQLKVLEARMRKEDNELKRQDLQLKIEEQQQKLLDAKRNKETVANEKEAGLESARMNVDNMLNTVARVVKTPQSVIESATGPVDQMLPTLSQDTADFEELVTTLGSQAFLSQIPLIKGMGQLSNAEGEKLQAALQNFSLRQSPKRLKENLAEAQRLLMKARANIAKQYGKPDSAPDVPAGVGATVIGGYTIEEVK